MKKGLIDVISLGCSKNLIDSERLLRRLAAKGYDVRHDAENPNGEWVVVNTCGFIQDAKEESIDLILQLGNQKKTRKIGKLVVMGCLSQRYMDDLKAEIPEVDTWYGKYDWNDFIENLPDRSSALSEKTQDWERTLTTPPHSTYLKISEGCNRFCSFCAIPIITGRHTSRPIQEILDETKDLVSKGVKEFNVIAQDLSSYGTDLYGRHALPELIDRMAQIEGVEWIRLHYAYPSDFPMELLDVMARHDNICKYIDIALQHISDKVLDNMHRHINGEDTRKLLAEMRRRVPDLKIRTTLMVGYPGEGEKEFEELLDFVKEQRFERMGAFAYSEEDDTWAAKNLDDDISEHEKQRRLDLLMELQQEIAYQRNLEMIGKTVKVLVDRIEGDTRIGRTQWDSPEVDPEIYVEGSEAEPGDFINAKITKAEPFELFGEQV
ncbi:MAG: 30S ribosomal protein S12 methylthiotransferase RimO [Muribaculaceae bacterium]|nr:30S ribosomal protein S12 methylthiotransferase RimO [Muribaculaceae bacterium]MDE6522822.1 30S ribosomal protein S12 methylthiotransferase RimO [Muribaculaceae bacterium]